jgi:hypothetical protein
MGGLNTSPLALAVIRLYARCIQIMCEIDEAIDDAEPVEVLLERADRLRERFEVFKRTGNYDTSDDGYDRAKAETKAGMLARHREYQWRKAELGRLLELGPDPPPNLNDTSSLKLTQSSCAHTAGNPDGSQPRAFKPDRVATAVFENQPVELDQHAPGRPINSLSDELECLIVRDPSEGFRGFRSPLRWRREIGTQPLEVVEDVSGVLADEVELWPSSLHHDVS